jgi:hypothetical protein
MAKTQPKAAKDQLQKFKEAARQHDCDEDESAFEDRLRKIAKAKAPQPETKPKKQKRG